LCSWLYSFLPEIKRVGRFVGNDVCWSHFDARHHR
jgi:hypothetical protein